MWNRACPLCFAKVPRSLVLTRGHELACPSCRAPLELSRASRVLGAACGLAASYWAFRGVLAGGIGEKWVLPLVAAFLAYGVASAAVLFFLSDLVVPPKPAVSHFPHAPE